MMQRVIEASHLVKRFGDTIAVNEASFYVLDGECLSVLGPSGCGKTTTLRLIAGFEQPDSGRIVVRGRDVAGMRPYERNIGLVFQDYALFPHMTVAQNIVFGMRHRRVDRSVIPVRLAQMLETVKLAGRENRRPSQLSGGEQQRVALARALATSPDLMLLDEPMSNLDAKLREQVRAELKAILAKARATTIIVTHDQQEAMSMADRVIVMNAGRVMQHGTPQEIYARPANRFVAEFIGRATWFTGHLCEQVAEGIRRFESDDGLQLMVADPGATQGSRYEVGIRPERIRVITGCGDGPATARPDVNHLTGRIHAVAHLGAEIQLTVSLDDGPSILVAERNVGQCLDLVMTPVTIQFEFDGCIVLPRHPESSAPTEPSPPDGSTRQSYGDDPDRQIAQSESTLASDSPLTDVPKSAQAPKRGMEQNG